MGAKNQEYKTTKQLATRKIHANKLHAKLVHPEKIKYVHSREAPPLHLKGSARGY